MGELSSIRKINATPEEDFPGKKNVDRVLSIINSRGINAEVFFHPDVAVTNLDLHLSLYGGTAGEVLKCLCFVAKEGPLVVMASGEIKIDMKKLSMVSGYTKISMARGEELHSFFKREPGGVDPLTIPSHIPIWIEKKLLEKQWVVGSCGSPHVGLKISPTEIANNSKGQIVDLVKE